MGVDLIIFILGQMGTLLLTVFLIGMAIAAILALGLVYWGMIYNG